MGACVPICRLRNSMVQPNRAAMHEMRYMQAGRGRHNTRSLAGDESCGDLLLHAVSRSQLGYAFLMDRSSLSSASSIEKRRRDQ